MRVSRWGLPLITHLFLNDPNAQDVKEQFNTSIPSGDMAFFSEPIAEFIETMTQYAVSAVEPADYAKKVTSRLCPVLLPYELETTARFSREAFNGRPLGDDAMDVMLTLACNKPLSDGVAPDKSRIRNEFPYYGEPYTKEEQAQVTRIAHASKK